MSYLSADKAEAELAQSVRKACNAEEVSPKRKHVRICVVYTWDHRSSAIIWNILKVQPLLSDEVQAFKALILVHRTINEGHPNVTK
ncbi:Putative ANTH domain-containing protein [Rhizopus microsporus]|nr:Putative ANTH domain-containing protein [Rhizopus microsporus]